MSLGLLTLIALAGVHLDPPDREEWRAGPDVDRMLGDVARCMVRGQPKKAHAILMMPPTAPESAERIISWVAQRSACLQARGKLRMRPPVLRGAIAERLYLETYALPPTAGEVSGPAWPLSADPQLVPYEVAQCAALRDPVAADMLVRSKRRTAEEAGAVDRLKPALNACARPGMRLDYNRTMIRSTIAEGLYRLRGGRSAAPGSRAE